jgi:hypothetical protein
MAMVPQGLHEAARFGDQANSLGWKAWVLAILSLPAHCSAANRAGSFKAPVSEALYRFSQSTNVRAVFQFEFLLGAGSVHPSQIYPIWVEP